jgi:hypothetical protein
MAYVDEYQGFVPIVSGFRPSTRNTNTASTYAPVSTGFVPVVGGFPRTQYRAPTPQYDDFFSSFDGEPYTSTSTSTSPSPYDFSAFRGPSSTSTPEQQTTATTSSSVISDLESYAHDDPLSDLDEIDFTGEEISGPDFTGPGVSGFNSFAEALGFTSGNPEGIPSIDPDVLSPGKGNPFGSTQSLLGSAAKGFATGALKGVLGTTAPIGLITGIIGGVVGTLGQQAALQAVVDQEAAIWGTTPDTRIGFWDSLGVYLGFTEPHTLMTEEEFDTGLMMSGEYDAPTRGGQGFFASLFGEPEKGGLFGEPHLAGQKNVREIEEIEEEIAHHQAIVEEIDAIEKGIQYEIDALNLVHDVVSGTDTGGVDPFGAEAVAAAPASGAEGELGIADPPSDDGDDGGTGSDATDDAGSSPAGSPW